MAFGIQRAQKIAKLGTQKLIGLEVLMMEKVALEGVFILVTNGCLG